VFLIHPIEKRIIFAAETFFIITKPYIRSMMTTRSIYTGEFIQNLSCPGSSIDYGFQILLLPTPSSTSYKEDDDYDEDDDEDFENDDFFIDDDDDDELI